MRNAEATSTISSTVWAFVKAWILSQTSSLRSRRPMKLRNMGSSPNSGAPIMAQKSCHCWPVTQHMATIPSDAGSMDGIMNCRGNS